MKTIFTILIISISNLVYADESSFIVSENIQLVESEQRSAYQQQEEEMYYAEENKILENKSAYKELYIKLKGKHPSLSQSEIIPILNELWNKQQYLLQVNKEQEEDK